MKIFLLSFVLLSIIYGLNGSCVRNQPDARCHERVFSEPEPRQIHYIYHGETCDCPKYHDVIVEQPAPVQKDPQNYNHEYGVEIPKVQQEDVKRYLFDVRVEKPIEESPEPTLLYKYDLHVPVNSAPESNVRYVFDGRVEEPVKPCGEKPWQGLVAQVDRVLMPARGCQNANHNTKSCSCGRSPSACTCGSNDYKLPVIYNSRYDVQSDGSHNFPVFSLPDSMMSLPSTYEVASKKIKRETTSDKKSKRREHKLSNFKPFDFKKISSKDLKTFLAIDPVMQKLPPKKSKVVTRQLRSNRKQESACGYTYESCDPKKNQNEGCPLCYRCKCDPIVKTPNNLRFSPYDIKVPYKFVTHDEAPGSPATVQEFDYEPSGYTGLKENDMYKKYIQQIISKYPEHMSRTMPVIQDQEKDLLKFIDELSKADKSPGKKVQNEDVRYKLIDDAMGMYQYYEKAVNSLPKPKDGKLFKKRGTVLEVIELDPNDFKSGTEDNLSESQ